MVKRNKELELEALKELIHNDGEQTGDLPQKDHSQKLKQI